MNSFNHTKNLEFLRQLEQQKILRNRFTSANRRNIQQYHFNIASTETRNRRKNSVTKTSNTLKTMMSIPPLRNLNRPSSQVQLNKVYRYEKFPFTNNRYYNSSPTSMSEIERGIISQQFIQAIKKRINHNANTFSRERRNLDMRFYYYVNRVGTCMFYTRPRESLNLELFIRNLVYSLRYTRCVYVIALIYIDKARILDEWFGIDIHNVHRIILTTLLLAGKYIEDIPLSNLCVSNLAGLTNNEELNILEKEFLKRINFSCYVPPSMYYQYHQEFLMSLEGQGSSMWL